MIQTTRIRQAQKKLRRIIMDFWMVRKLVPQILNWNAERQVMQIRINAHKSMLTNLLFGSTVLTEFTESFKVQRVYPAHSPKQECSFDIIDHKHVPHVVLMSDDAGIHYHLVVTNTERGKIALTSYCRDLLDRAKIFIQNTSVYAAMPTSNQVIKLGTIPDRLSQMVVNNHKELQGTKRISKIELVTRPRRMGPCQDCSSGCWHDIKVKQLVVEFSLELNPQEEEQIELAADITNMLQHLDYDEYCSVHPQGDRAKPGESEEMADSGWEPEDIL